MFVKLAKCSIIEMANLMESKIHRKDNDKLINREDDS